MFLDFFCFPPASSDESAQKYDFLMQTTTFVNDYFLINIKSCCAGAGVYSQT